MAFDVDAALKEGYTEAEVADYLGQEKKFDTAGARKEGYSDKELISHLTAESPAAPKSVPPGLWDKIKGKAQEGVDNLTKEVKNPLTAAKNLGLGVVKGVSDAVDGGAQLLTHGVSAATNMVAPDSAFAQTMQGEVKRVEGMNKDREDRYQAATDGSVLAGVGRFGGNAVLPVGQAGQVERGASLLTKVGDGMRMGGAAAALQPVYGNEDGKGMPYGLEKALQVGGGAVIGGAAPVVAKGGLELASKLGSKTAENYLTRTRMAQLFDKSKDAKADAEIIGDIGGMRDRVDRSILARDLTKREGKYAKNGVKALEDAGGTEAEIEAMKDWAALTLPEKDALRGTPQGDAIAGIMSKIDRVRDLTPGEPASLRLGVVRAATDLAPLPAPLRYAMRNMLGGKETRGASAEKVLDSRSQAAAALYRSENGASDGAKGMETLLQMAGQRKAAAEAAAAAPKVVEPKAFKPGGDLGKILTKENPDIDAAYATQYGEPTTNLASLAETPKPVPQPLPENTGILATIAKMREDEGIADATGGWNHGASAKEEFQNLLLNGKNKADEAKAAAKAARKAEYDAEGAGAGALSQANGTVINGGSLHETNKRLSEYGLDADASKKLITSLMESTEDEAAKANLKKLLDNSRFRNRDAFLATQDSVVSHAKAKGFQKAEAPGALSESVPSGALSSDAKDAAGDEIISKQLYKRKTADLQAQYNEDLAKIQGPNGLSPKAKKDAAAAVAVLKINGTTNHMQARQDAIAEVLENHPEHTEALRDIFGKYIK